MLVRAHPKPQQPRNALTGCQTQISVPSTFTPTPHYPSDLSLHRTVTTCMLGNTAQPALKSLFSISHRCQRFGLWGWKQPLLCPWQPRGCLARPACPIPYALPPPQLLPPQKNTPPPALKAAHYKHIVQPQPLVMH